MNNQLTGILTLLRSALTAQSLTLPESFDWVQAKQVLQKHRLAGLAFQGATRCGISKTSPELQPLMALFCRDIADHRAQLQELQLIYDQFDACGIDYLPLKGAVLKSLYPQGALRPMGDADILIRDAQYRRIRQTMTDLGMQFVDRNDYHFEWKGNRLSAELHITLMPPGIPLLSSYYKNIWQKALPTGHGCQYRLSEEDHFIFLLVHFARHYQEGAISAKSLCDFWVFRQAYPNMDEAYIRSELEKLRLLAFYQNVLKLLQVWFSGEPADPVTEQMTETVFRGGILDAEETMAALKILADRKRAAAPGQDKKSSIWRRAFPPFSQMVCRYPFLEKYPVLLPVSWLMRFWDLVGRPEKIQRNLRFVTNVSQLSEDCLSQLESQLQAVGLEITDPES